MKNPKYRFYVLMNSILFKCVLQWVFHQIIGYHVFVIIWVSNTIEYTIVNFIQVPIVNYFVMFNFLNYAYNIWIFFLSTVLWTISTPRKLPKGRCFDWCYYPLWPFWHRYPRIPMLEMQVNFKRFLIDTVSKIPIKCHFERYIKVFFSI